MYLVARQGRVAAAAMGIRSGKFLIVLKSERGFDSLYALNIGGQIDEDQGKKEETHGQTGSC